MRYFEVEGISRVIGEPSYCIYEAEPTIIIHVNNSLNLFDSIQVDNDLYK